MRNSSFARHSNRLAPGLSAKRTSCRRHVVIRHARAETLESRRLLSATPTSFEQYMLELINRARANPAAEAARLGIDLNEGLAAGTISNSPVQPLAFNPALVQAAQDYTAALLGAYNYFDHQLNGTTAQGRMTADGYVFSGSFTSSESITAETLAPGHGHTPLSVNTGITNTEYNNLFIDSGASGRGDRLNLLDASFREIGIGTMSSLAYQGLDTPPDHTNDSAVLTTADFAASGADPNPFLTGVVFDDTAKTQFYAPGEGVGNVTITATRVSDSATFSATTWLSGGYSLAVPAGTYTVVASGGTLSGPITQTNVVVGAQNVEADFIDTGPKHLTFSQQPASTATGSTLNSIPVNVDNSGGTVISTDNTNVSIAIGAGPSGATLGGTTTVAALNGVATFTDLNLPTAGNYTLVATDGSDTSAVSSTFTINSTAPAETIGGLDPTFGVGGLASHNVGFTSTDGTAQDGNQSVIIGTLGVAPGESFGITRYNADGGVDTSFGANGVVSVGFGDTDAVPTAVDVLAGGQILVAGTATTFSNGAPSGSEFAVAMCNPDGSLDTNFGGGTGKALVSFSSTAGTLSNDVLHAMMLNAGGTIYLGGESNASGNSGDDFAVAALNPDGTPDASFGTNGKALQDFAGGDDVINSLALQSNGDLVAAGSATVGGIVQIALARFLPNGTLDKHFGGKGLVTTKVRGVFDSASSVVIQPKGQIVIGGVSATGSGSSLGSDFLVARYTSAGSLDRTFGSGGTVITSFGQPSAVTQVILQTNGEVIASGKTTGGLSNIVPNELNVAIAEYTTRGTLDTAFNGTGTVVISLGGTGNPQAAQAARPGFEVAGVAASISLSPADAQGLGTAFAQFEQSSQGVVAVTQGGELLDVGNRGANTVEAAIITTGVNLAAAVIAKLPALVVEGAKESVSVKITEGTGIPANGTVTLQLYASPDGQLDAGLAPFLSMPERINLRPSQSRTFPLRCALPSSSGTFFVLATINTGPVHSLNTNSVPAISSSSVQVAPPFVDLAGANLPSLSTPVIGKPTTISFTVTNNGNILAHSVPVEILASPDGTVASGTEIAQPTLLLNLPIGITRTYRLTFTIPTTLTANTYVLVALLDPTNTLNDPNLANNLIVGQTPFTVA